MRCERNEGTGGALGNAAPVEYQNAERRVRTRGADDGAAALPKAVLASVELLEAARKEENARDGARVRRAEPAAAKREPRESVREGERAGVVREEERTRVAPGDDEAEG